MKLNKREIILVAALVIVLGSMGYYKYIIVPQIAVASSTSIKREEKRKEFTRFKTDVASQDKLEDALMKLQEDFRNEAKSYYLTLEQAEIILLLNDFGKETNVKVDGIEFEEPRVEILTDEEDPENPVAEEPVETKQENTEKKEDEKEEDTGDVEITVEGEEEEDESDQYDVYTVSLEYESNYSSLIELLTLITSYEKRIMIKDININKEESEETKAGILKGNIKLDFYVIGKILDEEDKQYAWGANQGSASDNPFSEFSGYYIPSEIEVETEDSEKDKEDKTDEDKSESTEEKENIEKTENGQNSDSTSDSSNEVSDSANSSNNEGSKVSNTTASSGNSQSTESSTVSSNTSSSEGTRSSTVTSNTSIVGSTGNSTGTSNTGSSESSGSSGSSRNTRSSESTGSSGDSSNTGSSGNTESSGGSNTTGASGSTGNSGSSSNTGGSGSTGNSGNSSNTGGSASTGNSGSSSNTGGSGSTGNSGSSNTAGSSGSTGNSGSSSNTGGSSSTGTSGSSGDTKPPVNPDKEDEPTIGSKELFTFEELKTLKLSKYEDSDKEIKGSLSLDKDRKTQGEHSLNLKYDFVKKRQLNTANITFNEDVIIKHQVKMLSLAVKPIEQNNNALGIVVEDREGTEYKLPLTKNLSWYGWKRLLVKLPLDIKYPATVKKIYVESTNFNEDLVGDLLIDNLRIRY